MCKGIKIKWLVIHYMEIPIVNVLEYIAFYPFIHTDTYILVVLSAFTFCLKIYCENFPMQLNILLKHSFFRCHSFLPYRYTTFT